MYRSATSSKQSTPFSRKTKASRSTVLEGLSAVSSTVLFPASIVPEY